jgi:hypothetical protein
MCCIVLGEDTPQLVITALYLDSVDSFKGGLDSNDTVAVVSLVLSVVSLLLNRSLAASFCRCERVGGGVGRPRPPPRFKISTL